MGLGVLEPSQLVVPGTIQLFDNATDHEMTAHLKHTADGKTILAPQPSDSPNDPLNWPTLKKDGVFLLLLINSILAGIHGPVLSPVTILLTQEFDVSVNDVAKLSSYMLLLIACTAYIDAAASHVYGKRFIFIASLAIMMASDAWASKAANYGSLMGARILSGVGQSAFECLTLSVIPDLYYVHQRSLRVALWIFCYHTGVYLGVVIAIQVIGVSSWRMAFAGLAISEGVMLLLTFLFFHEPVYKRFHVDPLANMSEDAVLEKRNDPTFHEEAPDPENLPQSNTAAGEPPKTFLQNLRLFNGRMSTNNFFQLLYRSIVLTAHPTILWAATAGLLLSWPVGCSFTIDAFMTLPPYNFSSQAVGDMYLAPWLGIIVGLSISDPLFSSLTKYLTKRNNNVYEPEFRLYQTIPGIIFAALGFVGWGWGEQVGVAWIGLAFFFAFQVGGAVIFNNGVIGYVIDAHRELANESQVILFAIKNFFSFALGYFFVPWWESAGPKTVWSIVAGVCAALALGGIPMYIFGKKLRAFWSRHHFLGITDIKH